MFSATIVVLVCLLFSCQADSDNELIFIGGGSSVITSARFSANAGSISELFRNPSGPTPTFLATNSQKNMLYAVNEGPGLIQSFKIDSDSGKLTPVGSSASNYGEGTAHLALDRSLNWLGAANYNAGNYALHAILKDFSVSNSSVFEMSDQGSGPHPNQDGPHPHQFVFSPDNKFIFVPDLGTDKIMQFEFDATSGSVKPNSAKAFVSTAAGAGPRHLVFSPLTAVAYGANELDSTLNVYAYDEHSGVLRLRQTLSTLPSAYTGPANYPAEVIVSRDGRRVYVSNRGDDSIAAFRVVNEGNGELSLLTTSSCGGKFPRHIILDPSQTRMLVSNQNSNNVAVLAVDAHSGEMKVLSSVAVDSPQCVLFAN